MSCERMKEEFPLHWFVWHNDFVELQKTLDLNVVSIVSLNSLNNVEDSS